MLNISDFITARTQNAMTSLGASTHLYGRRLVLEWANEDETVEQLRLKTAEKFLASGESFIMLSFFLLN